ncbi:hypothetical protein CRE_06848 [Caenorhabditis remanei]|uniref:Uncharacterized protein n=1 Tax=Caenorhabditis remanei TaxID=31234 RepID=E3MZK8_CAERE|nr:hypothetical protein CRE_06848 [Caenorhabditis remanei]
MEFLCCEIQHSRFQRRRRSFLFFCTSDTGCPSRRSSR